MVNAAQIKSFQSEMDFMNQYINQNGEIRHSSNIIKHWHDLTNDDWVAVMAVPLFLEQKSLLNLKGWVIRDCERLAQHIDKYGSHCDNLLYPSIKVTNSLPKRLTMIDVNADVKRVKSVTFRTMMNLREAYCEGLGLDLPNADSSKGKLDPTPREELFE